MKKATLALSSCTRTIIPPLSLAIRRPFPLCHAPCRSATNWPAATPSQMLAPTKSVTRLDLAIKTDPKITNEVSLRSHHQNGGGEVSLRSHQFFARNTLDRIERKWRKSGPLVQSCCRALEQGHEKELFFFLRITQALVRINSWRHTGRAMARWVWEKRQAL
jgi:hypothetical protein